MEEVAVELQESTTCYGPDIGRGLLLISHLYLDHGGTGSHTGYQSLGLFILAAVLNLVNTFLARGSFRYITIGLINLFLLGLAIRLFYENPVVLFTPPPQGSIAGLHRVVIYLLLVWVAGRSVYLAWHDNSDISKIFIHFDKSITLTFLAYLVAGVAELELPGGLWWLVASFLLNLLTISLSLANNSVESYPVWFGLGLAAIVIFPLAAAAETLFPILLAPAQLLYDLARPVVLLVWRVFVFILIGYLRLTKMAPQAAATPSASFSPLPDIEQTVARWPWLERIFEALIWLIVLIKTRKRKSSTGHVSLHRVYECENCTGCSQREACTKSLEWNRRLEVNITNKKE